MEAIRKYTPELARVMDNMSLSFYTDDEKRVIGELFPTCEKISIDYAVMEKLKRFICCLLSLAWSDLGSWDHYIPCYLKIWMGIQPWGQRYG